MAKKKEVEIKFVVEDLRALARKLLDAGFRLVTHRTHESNVLYDLPGQPLRRRGELLRLRQYGPTWTLTHKGRGKSGRHKSRVETETVVADGARMDAILCATGFEPTFRYEKFRTQWSDGQGQVVVDETPIGDLAEIEGSPKWIDSTAARLGVRPEQYITASYAGLFFAWKRQTGSAAAEMTFKAVGKNKRPRR